MFFFLVVSLANWRVCKMLSDVDEDGPGDVLHKIRYWLGVMYNEHGVAFGNHWWSRAILCIKCLSIWTSVLLAIPFGIDYGWLHYPTYIFALSGAVIFIDSLAED